jgi:4-hydroxybenzoyl-CoA thioesterase
MFLFRRPVRFAEVDAARLVFFARYADYCHEALEALFAELPGGYARLTLEQDIGIPTVRIAFEFEAPLRYGDEARFEVEIVRIGRTSVSLRHVIRRDADGALVATADHVIVFARLSTLTPVPIPEDVRALLVGYSRA